MSPLACGRCHLPLTLDQAEHCWFCPRHLCGDCWETFGHCGHQEADILNARLRQHYQEARNA